MKTGLPFKVIAERTTAPLGEMLHAARSLREIAAAGNKGSGWAGMSSVVVLAFAVEAFCNTYGPQLYPDTWEGRNGERGLERKPLREKLRMIGARAGIKVDFGRKPWRGIADLIHARDALAHPKPKTHRIEITMRLTHEQTSAVHATGIVPLPWEQLAKPERAAEMAAMVEGAMSQILEGLGHPPGELTKLGMGSYSLTRAPK